MIKERIGASEKMFFLGLGGLLGGLANGLLGAGGGIIMTFALEAVMTEAEMDSIEQ